MKIFLFLIFLVASLVTKSQCTWNSLQSDDWLQPTFYSESSSEPSVFKISPTNEHYAFNVTRGLLYGFNGLIIRKYNGSNWTTVTQLSLNNIKIHENSICFDRQGNIYVVYFKGTGAGTNGIMKYDGLSWSAVGTFDQYNYLNASQPTFITVDRNDTLYVGYENANNEYVVKKYNGTSWVQLGGVIDTDISKATIISVSGQMVYLKYYKTSGVNNQICLFNGSNWEIVQPDIIYTAGYMFNSKIAVSKDSVLFAASLIQMPDQTYRARVFSHFGGVWQVYHSPNFSPPLPANEEITLLFDSSGVLPNVGFRSLDKTSYIVMKADSASGWDTVCVKQLNNFFATFQLDSNNLPLISESNLSGVSSLFQFSDSLWTYIGNPQVSEGKTSALSLAANSIGDIYMAYTLQFDGTPHVKVYNDSTWNELGVISDSIAKGGSIHILIDGTNVPFVAMKDLGIGNKVSVMNYDGSQWRFAGQRGISQNGVNTIKMCKGSNGKIIIAYCDSISHQIEVKQFDGTSWTSLGNVGTGYFLCDINVDRNGIIYLLYSDNTLSGNATIKKFDGSTWSVVSSNGLTASGSITKNSSLVLDTNNIPYVGIVYTSAINGASIVIKKFNGTSWVYVSNTTTGLGAIYSKLLIGPNNNLVVAYSYNSGTNTPENAEVVVRELVQNDFITIAQNPISAGAGSNINCFYDTVNNKFVLGYTSGNVYVKEFAIASEAPIITSQPVSINLCTTDTGFFTIQVDDGDSYTWQVDFGSGFQSITSGQYSGQNTDTLKIWNYASTNSYRCVVSKCGQYVISNVVSVSTLSTPYIYINIDFGSSFLCRGDSVSLSYSGSTSPPISWVNPGVFGSPVYVKPITTTTYSIVTAPNASGCVGRRTLTINVDSFNLNVIANVSNSSACPGDQITLTGSGSNSSSYYWNNGVTNGVPFIVNSSQEYIVTSYNNVNGCPYSDTINIALLDCSTFPGDANYDGIANNNDLLELGLRYGSIGIPRSIVSNNWQSYLSADWGTDTVSTGYNLKHADCNGDGTINLDDTLAINLNYGLTHTLRLADINRTNTTGDIYFGSAQLGYGAGQQVAIDVYLGEGTNPLQNFYGAAFTIDYNDNTLIQPGSLSFSIDDVSWVGTINTDAIRLTKPMEGIETIDAAICKTNHINTSGAGKIGTLRFIASNTIGNLSVTANNAYYIDNTAMQTPLTSATYTVNINTAVGLQNQTSNSNISIYPNPNNGSFTLSNLNTREEYNLEVKDVLGRTVYTDVIKSNSSKANIKLNQAAGVYWLQITSKLGGVEVHKVVVE